METLEAVRRIKQELPECRTILGVSNISFGLATYSRRVLNSVFLREAVDRGLDCAIVNYSKIYPLYKIPEPEVEVARRLIFQDASQGDPLQAYMAFFSGVSKKTDAVVVGAEPGAAKLAKAHELGVPILDEAAFAHLLETGEVRPSGDGAG